MADRPRDSQRAKILAACDDFRAVRPAECDLPFTRSFTRSDWDMAQMEIRRYRRQPWVERYQAKHELQWPTPIANVYVYKSKRGSDHIEATRNHAWFNLSPTRFDKLELLRYLAQTLIPEDAAWHGPEFVRSFNEAIKREMSPEAQGTMKQLLRLRNVRRRIESKEVRARQRAKYQEKRTKLAVSRLQETIINLEKEA